MRALLHLALVTAFAPTPEPRETPDTAAASEHDEGDATIGTAYLRVQGTSYEAVQQALLVRAPELSARDSTREAPNLRSGERWAFVDVRPSEGGFEITLVLGDGRGYDRVITAEPADGPRMIAVAVANLLAAIAEERIVADRSDAVVPDDLGPPPVPVDAPAAVAPTDPPPQVAAAHPPSLPPPPRWTLGPSLGPVALFGLGTPAETGAFAGIGGATGLRIVSPRRWAGALELRLLGHHDLGYRLLRLRITGAFGHLLRRGRFALDLLARVGVEPWRVSNPDGRAAVHTDRPEVIAPSLLLSASLHVAPGVRVVDGRVRVELGLPVELGYAGVPDRGLRTARILLVSDGGSRDLFRVGGVELAIGAALALEFDGPRARPR